MVVENHDCQVNSKECFTRLSGTVLTTLRIVGTRDWHNMQDGWAKTDGLSILTKGWQKDDRLCEGSILLVADKIKVTNKIYNINIQEQIKMAMYAEVATG